MLITNQPVSASSLAISTSSRTFSTISMMNVSSLILSTAPLVSYFEGQGVVGIVTMDFKVYISTALPTSIKY